jgi:hypothetical protein
MWKTKWEFMHSERWGEGQSEAWKILNKKKEKWNGNILN